MLNQPEEKNEQNLLYESARPLVLIVDGDHPSVVVVSRMIKAYGLRVDAANGAIPALNCLSKSRYDVVIADLETPDLSGYTLACWIREKSPGTKVIVMTGRSHSEVAQYMNTGMVDHWIFKPFNMNDLEMALDNIVPKDL